MTTLSRDNANAVKILESWLDNLDPTAGYYVKSIPQFSRAISAQRFEGKDYICVWAVIGGRSVVESFLVPRNFWDYMEKEINPSAPSAQKDNYPAFEI